MSAFSFGLPAARALSIFNEIRIWVTVVAALAAVATMVASYYQIRLTSEVSEQKDQELQRQQNDFKGRLALALKETAKAQSQTAEAQRETAQYV